MATEPSRTLTSMEEHLENFTIMMLDRAQSF